MFFLMSGGGNKRSSGQKKVENLEKVKELFSVGRFPVVTTAVIDEDRPIGKVLGLVACRGFDSEDAFYGMAVRAVNKGAQAIVGYQEQVAFHPDGSKYFTCYGTAVQFAPGGAREAPHAAQQEIRLPVRSV
ncbi:MAG: hypothetical protein LBD82_05430 [Deltaproteobacteria bacterium]|jgi:hypothetical protein|nr:hypothetical protein [Deltaproteobacteria bacterium]